MEGVGFPGLCFRNTLGIWLVIFDLGILRWLVLHHLAGIVSSLAARVGRRSLLGFQNLGLSCQEGQKVW